MRLLIADFTHINRPGGVRVDLLRTPQASTRTSGARPTTTAVGVPKGMLPFSVYVPLHTPNNRRRRRPVLRNGPVGRVCGASVFLKLGVSLIFVTIGGVCT